MWFVIVRIRWCVITLSYLLFNRFLETQKHRETQRETLKNPLTDGLCGGEGMNSNPNQVSRENQSKPLFEMGLDELYDMWFWLTELDKAIETLRSGLLSKVLDEEDIRGAVSHMVYRTELDRAIYMRQENGLPNCVDKFLEELHEKVVHRIKEVNKEIERKTSRGGGE